MGPDAQDTAISEEEGTSHEVVCTVILGTNSLATTQDDLLALSPFLPGTWIQYAWDSTSLGWFKTCPRLYYYQMIEGWTTTNEGIHLRFGIEYHQALHDYENFRVAGEDHDEALFDTVWALLKRIYDWHPEPKKKSEALKSKRHLVRTVIWYLDKFKNDPAKTYIMADGRPAMEVSFKFELDWGPMMDKAANAEFWNGKNPQPYILCGHLDRIVTFQDDLFFMDRKTTVSTPGSYYFDQYDPNNQMTLYTFASQVIFQSPIKGGIIDAAQIAVGFSAFQRGFTYRTPDQIQEWVDGLHYWFAKQEECAVTNNWPMNDTACDKFGGCRFREICAKSPQVREQFLKSGFVQGKTWNPLIPR